MTTVAMVCHSGYGHTGEQAKAEARGVAKVVDVNVLLLNTEQAQQDGQALQQADANIFGSPTYFLGSVSGPFKVIMDATSKAWYRQNWKNKIAGGFTSSASQIGDKLNPLIQLTIFAAQHGMIWDGKNLLLGNNNNQSSVNDFNFLGSFSRHCASEFRSRS